MKMPPRYRTKSQAQALIKSRSIETDSGCWEWQGGHRAKGLRRCLLEGERPKQEGPSPPSLLRVLRRCHPRRDVGVPPVRQPLLRQPLSSVRGNHCGQCGGLTSEGEAIRRASLWGRRHPCPERGRRAKNPDEMGVRCRRVEIGRDSRCNSGLSWWRPRGRLQCPWWKVHNGKLGRCCSGGHAEPAGKTPEPCYA